MTRWVEVQDILELTGGEPDSDGYTHYVSLPEFISSVFATDKDEVYDVTRLLTLTDDGIYAAEQTDREVMLVASKLTSAQVAEIVAEAIADSATPGWDQRIGRGW